MKNKCCGNCKHFKYEDAVGWGRCVGHMTEFGVHCSHTGCLEHKFVKNAINGWTEITPDNVDEVDCIPKDKVVVGWFYNKEFRSCSLPFFLFTLKSIVQQGGFYYYVLPDLKIE